MFFGRRKHAAPTPVSLVPTAAPDIAARELTDEVIFAAVQRTMQAVFGEDGEWTVARRSEEQTDQIFHEVLVHSLATAVTAGVVAARGSVGTDASSSNPVLEDVAVLDGAAPDDAALSGQGSDDSRFDGAGFDDAPAAGPLGLLRAPRANPWLDGAPVSDADGLGIDTADEPAAFSWEPAPITRWADLKRPVTGPVAVVETAATTSKEKAA